ncbi:amino acid transporter [Thecaphora frezii]
MASHAHPNAGAVDAFPDEKSTTSVSDNKEVVSEHIATHYDGHVEENNGLKRELKGRHISMIAIGGALGTGLVIGTGAGLANAGPASLFIGYSIMGVMCAAVMSALGEMATYMPHPRGFAGHATRFVSPEFGVATGYVYLAKYLLVTANNINAFALVCAFWTSGISGAVFIAIVTAVIIFFNFAGIRWFGELEFYLSFIKIITMTSLILLLLIIDLGGSPNGDRIGFRNWEDGKAFKAYPGFEGAKGRFLGFWSTLVVALFAYTGTELVGVTVGEAANPRKTVPSAIRKTFFRIVFFYIVGSLLVGMVVPASDPSLISANKRATSAAASPFVVAIQNAGIGVLPSIVNASLLVFTLSAANSDQYIAARTLYGLALDGQAPRIFRRVNKLGVPWVALSFTALFCSLAFINLASGGATTFGYLTAAVTIMGGLTWINILISHACFMRALKVQGVSRDKLPWKSPLQPYSTYVALVVVTIVVLTKGWSVFVHGFKWKSFITNYIGLPYMFIIMFGWKFWHRTRFWKPEEVDLVTGAREFDEADAQFWKADEEKLQAELREASFTKKVGIYIKNW